MATADLDVHLLLSAKTLPLPCPFCSPEDMAAAMNFAAQLAALRDTNLEAFEELARLATAAGGDGAAIDSSKAMDGVGAGVGNAAQTTDALAKTLAALQAQQQQVRSMLSHSVAASTGRIRGDQSEQDQTSLEVYRLRVCSHISTPVRV